MKQVHLAGIAAQPWRNGGGVTHELLAWPDAQGWLLRVSVADINQAGPFSAFDGIHRWFAVIDGAGVVLGLPAGDVAVGPDDAPLHFDGEAAPGCRLISGPTQDLNLMARRAGDGVGVGVGVGVDVGEAGMHRAAAASTLDGDYRWRAIYTADAVRVDCDGVAQLLPAGTLLWSDTPDASVWTLLDPGRAWWLTLSA